MFHIMSFMTGALLVLVASPVPEPFNLAKISVPADGGGSKALEKSVDCILRNIPEKSSTFSVNPSNFNLSE